MVSTNGSASTPPIQLSLRPKYPQNWTAYNAAQSEEKARFIELLADLCESVPEPEYTFGRPRLPLADMLFACAYKVYSGFSVRRFTSDLRDACERGHVARTPHFNSVSNYMSNPDLTPILMELITLSSTPLKAVESEFAIDATGFSTSQFVRWFNRRYRREIDNRQWLKLHIFCGINTNIVTAAEVSGWTAHDTTYFEPLLTRTAEHFQMSEVSADKAYLSHRNMDMVDALGATPFIPFKVNTVPVWNEDSVWAKMYYRFMLDRQAFMARYHKRSNVESTFSAIKAKFGNAVRSKSPVGQINEVLCKVLCHNICTLILESHALGIDLDFRR